MTESYVLDAGLTMAAGQSSMAEQARLHSMRQVRRMTPLGLLPTALCDH